MWWNFETILFTATVACGAITLADRLLWRKARYQAKLQAMGAKNEAALSADERDRLKMAPFLVDYGVAFFPVLLCVLILRSFVIEPFQIPSGSMEPSVMTGDFVAVNKYYYGLRLPVFHTKIIAGHEPKRGDIMVFRYPVDPNVNFIKRVVGLPGDLVVYKNKVLTINGRRMKKTFQKADVFVSENGEKMPVQRWLETLGTVKHTLFQETKRQSVFGADNRYAQRWIVPQGHYFVMGDNRDESDDSRYWGMVPENHILGKALLVWMSWDTHQHAVRWHRIGQHLV